MNRNMVNYLNDISNNDWSEKIEIFAYKFSKFRSLFRILSDYSESIAMIKSNKSTHSELNCKIKFGSAKTAKSVYENIKDVAAEAHSLDEISISLEKSSINIVLIKTEAEETESDNTEERRDDINEN